MLNCENEETSIVKEYHSISDLTNNLEYDYTNDNKPYDVGALKLDVYTKKYSELTNDDLDSFYITPSIKKASDQKIPLVKEPKDLPLGFNKKDWIFEGYLAPLSDEEIKTRDMKRRLMNEYMDKLSTKELANLENRIKEKVKSEKRLETQKRGEVFDERDDLAVYIFEDNQVWIQKAPIGYSADYSNGTAYEGKGIGPISSEPDFENLVLNGDGLALISQYVGHNMTSYPIRTHGCLSRDSQSGLPASILCHCSGTKISARMVITAGHCLTDGEKKWSGTAAKFWIPGVDGIYQAMTGSYDMPNGYRYRSARSVHSNWWNYNWDNYDMGVFVLRGNQGNCDWGNLSYDNQGSLLGDTINICSVPAPTQQCSASPFYSLCGGSIYCASGTVESAGTHTFRYDVTAKPGMSGSGVYKLSNGNRTVIGVAIEKTPNYGRACKINNGKLGFLNNVKSQFPDSSACSN